MSSITKYFNKIGFKLSRDIFNVHDLKNFITDRIRTFCLVGPGYTNNYLHIRYRLSCSRYIPFLPQYDESAFSFSKRKKNRINPA